MTFDKLTAGVQKPELLQLILSSNFTEKNYYQNHLKRTGFTYMTVLDTSMRTLAGPGPGSR